MPTDQSHLDNRDLKPCPKCGQTRPVIVPALLGGEFYVVCGGCHIETPIAKTREAAIQLWNSGVLES